MNEYGEFYHPLVVPAITDAFGQVPDKFVQENLAHWSSGTGIHGNIVTRLDWELDAKDGLRPEDNFNPLDQQWLSIMREQVITDLSDLVVNGDTKVGSDPLLKVIDGEKKRNTELKSLTVNSIGVYVSYHTRKDSWEYTVYINASAGW